MKRLICFASFVLLAALAGPLHSPAAAQDKGAAPARDSAKQSPKNAKAPDKAKRTKAGKAKAEKLQAEKPGLTREELAKPYAGNTLYGPPAPPRAGADNATVPEYDPAPKTRPFAKQEDSSPINFRIGAEKVVDPLTGKEVTPKADVSGVRDSVKNMDLKGAMDKVGGKAEIQVDILKF
ncbi:MAG TPA: hypothetical protein VN419_09620 [Humidesulfovibrio sp.]|uniref:hypothetical protein n=1 Tax=Humidesulfovibrio sp. TaxID=2910988 RepID=UPI002C9865B0|nr:hypothetical protein [Humidesulfovibrio sp.]HWR04265.1 hypothetical protein [Humidesulfovibrio sp.]